MYIRGYSAASRMKLRSDNYFFRVQVRSSSAWVVRSLCSSWAHSQLHTGFLGNVVHLTKADLDDFHKDSRGSEDFAVDLLFMPIEGDGGEEANSAGDGAASTCSDEGSDVVRPISEVGWLLLLLQCFLSSTSSL